MATSFNNKYTELEDINSGNQLQDGDDILANHMNSALQNTAHLKTLLNNSVVRNVQLNNNKLVLTLATKGNDDSIASTTTVEYGGVINIPITRTTIVEEGETIYIDRATIKDSIVNYGNGLYAFTFATSYRRETHMLSIDTSAYNTKYTIYLSQGYAESNTRSSSNDDLYIESLSSPNNDLPYLIECKKIVSY